MAVTSPLTETSIDGAEGALVSIIGSMDMALEEVEKAAGLVQEAAHPDANIIFGAAFDETMEDEIRVVIIATCFEDGPQAGLKKKEDRPADRTPERTPERSAPPSDEDKDFGDILKIFS